MQFPHLHTHTYLCQCFKSTVGGHVWRLLQNEWLFSARQAQIPVQVTELCAIALTDKPTVQIQLTHPVWSSSVPWLIPNPHQAHDVPTVLTFTAPSAAHQPHFH